MECILADGKGDDATAERRGDGLSKKALHRAAICAASRRSLVLVRLAGRRRKEGNFQRTVADLRGCHRGDL